MHPELQFQAIPIRSHEKSNLNQTIIFWMYLCPNVKSDLEKLWQHRMLSKDNLSSPHDLDLQMAHLHMMENNCVKLFWNWSTIVQVRKWTKIWPSSVTLTFSLPEWMFQMANLHVMEKYSVKLFWNPSTIVEVMVRINSDGQMHIHQTVIVTTMSCL